MKPLLDNISSELDADVFSLVGISVRIDAGSACLRARREPPNFCRSSFPVSVKMIRTPEPGKEVIIGIFRAGEMFAVPPVFDGGPYPVDRHRDRGDGIASDRTRGLSSNSFSESPEFAFEVIAWTCEMLREKTSMIRNALRPPRPSTASAAFCQSFAESGTGLACRYRSLSAVRTSPKWRA